MQGPAQFLFIRVQRCRIIARRCSNHRIGKVMNDPPQATEETRCPFDPLIAPLQITFRRRGKQDEQPRRIRAVFFHDFFRRNDIALGFGHLRAVFDHHSLRQQVFERLVRIDQSGVLEDFGEETRIKQMQDRVFDAADVLVDRRPVVAFVDVPGRFHVARVGIAEIVPGRADERIHRVGFAAGRFAAFRALAVDKLADRGQRRYRTGIKPHILRQPDRQFFLRRRHRAAIFAVDDRNRRAPIALPRNQPVA